MENKKGPTHFMAIIRHGERADHAGEKVPNP